MTNPAASMESRSLIVYCCSTKASTNFCRLQQSSSLKERITQLKLVIPTHVHHLGVRDGHRPRLTWAQICSRTINFLRLGFLREQGRQVFRGSTKRVRSRPSCCASRWIRIIISISLLMNVNWSFMMLTHSRSHMTCDK